MLHALLGSDQGPLNVLCLGAHCDDIEIGCGGTLLTLLSGHRAVHLTWIVFASNEARRDEAMASADLFSEQAASIELRIHEFRDGFLPTEQARVKETFEEIRRETAAPDLIFTHYRHDLHQDHRLINELTWNTYRNHLILEYEIPKWDGDLGQPAVFVPLSRETGMDKIHKLHQAYASQASKAWFSEDLFWSLMRIRGMECNAESTIAEAFYCRKLRLELR